MNKHKNQDELPPDQRYSTVCATWKPILDEKKFYKVQALLKENLMHKNNGAKPTKHSYLFNGQILFCEKCGARMEGRNGHGRGNKIYYYYYCINKACRHKVPEYELELTVQKIIKVAAGDPLRLKRIADKINAKLVSQLPYLKEQRRLLAEELSGVSDEAKRIMDELLNIGAGRVFVEERLADLDKRRTYLNNRMASLDVEITLLDRKVIDDSQVKGVFGAFDEIFKDRIPFYQKRILLNWILANVKIGNDDLKLSIDTRGFRSDIRQVLRGDVVPDTTRGSGSTRPHFVRACSPFLGTLNNVGALLLLARRTIPSK